MHTTMLTNNTTMQKKIYTQHKLLKELSEIKAVLDVEAQLVKALVKMAIARQAMGLQLSF